LTVGHCVLGCAGVHLKPMAEWITDRLPTAEDADSDGEVIIRRDSKLRGYMHWSCVVPGQPWWSPNAAARAAQPTPPPAPAPTRVVTAMAAAGTRFYVACNDGTIWTMGNLGGEWYQLHSIPQPEATDD
jgi:hypothetical protein